MSLHTFFRIFAAIFLFCGLAGCNLAPKYVRPDAPIPHTYGHGDTDHEEELADWKVFFQDKTMHRLICMALENNRDLRIALLNVERARAQYRIQRADLLPTINATAGSSSELLPADFSRSREADVEHQYTAGLGFSSYELDLFGRIRNLSEQALEAFYSLEEESKAAQITLIAETAAMYLQLVADRESHDLAVATAENREQELDLIRTRFRRGIASDLEVSQAETLLQEAKVRVASSATKIEQDSNALVLLMGTPLPTDIPEVRKLADISPLPDVPAGLPSSLLERRPDILAAEHALKGANASIGAARAKFFPRISLTGSLGKMSEDFDSLWDAASGTWSFLPQISLPIFDMGRNLAQLNVSKTERELAVTRYEKSIQTAFKEVSDALAQRRHIGAQLASQKSMVASSARSYSHAAMRYKTGLSPFINVLDTQRSLFAAQNNLISTYLLREANALSLYKALGGGWHE